MNAEAGTKSRALLLSKSDDDVNAGLALLSLILPGSHAASSSSTRSFQIFDCGWDYRAICVNDTAVRVARRDDIFPKLSREPELLSFISEVSSISVPRMIVPIPGVAIYPWIEGERVDRLSNTAIGQLADLLLGLRRISPFSDMRRASEQDESEPDRLTRHLRLAETIGLESDEFNVVNGAAVDRSWSQFVPVRVHGDLTADHILVDRDGSISGIIDWSDSKLGDPALDIAGIYSDFDIVAAQQVLAAYCASDFVDERAEDLWPRVLFRAAWGTLIEQLHDRLPGHPL